MNYPVIICYLTRYVDYNKVLFIPNNSVKGERNEIPSFEGGGYENLFLELFGACELFLLFFFIQWLETEEETLLVVQLPLVQVVNSGLCVYLRGGRAPNSAISLINDLTTRKTSLSRSLVQQRNLIKVFIARTSLCVRQRRLSHKARSTVEHCDGYDLMIVALCLSIDSF